MTTDQPSETFYPAMLPPAEEGLFVLNPWKHHEKWACTAHQLEAYLRRLHTPQLSPKAAGVPPTRPM